MIKFENVPYRRWRAPKRGPAYLRETAQHKRIMKMIGDAMQSGKAVDYALTIVDHESRKVYNGQPYDVVSVRISE